VEGLDSLIENKGKIILNSNELIRFLKAVPNGVLGIDREFDVVNKSLNLALISNEKVILSFLPKPTL
jgi:hypothetical protein